jgi:hypothetical protein
VPDRFCEHEYVPSLQRAVGTPQEALPGAGAPLHVGDAATEIANIPSPDVGPEPHAFTALTRMKYVPLARPVSWRVVPVTTVESVFEAPAAVPTEIR